MQVRQQVASREKLREIEREDEERQGVWARVRPHTGLDLLFRPPPPPPPSPLYFFSLLFLSLNSASCSSFSPFILLFTLPPAPSSIPAGRDCTSDRNVQRRGGALPRRGQQHCGLLQVLQSETHLDTGQGILRGERQREGACKNENAWQV